MPDPAVLKIIDPRPPIRKIKYGWNPDLPDRRDRRYSAPPPVLARRPPKVDLRDGRMPGVYAQGHVGSCVPNAVAAACEYLMARGHEDRGGDPPYTPSRLFLYYNARKIENSIGADDGCQIRDVIRSLAVDGFCRESPGRPDAWPYVEENIDVRPPDTCYECARRELITSAARVTPTLDQLQGCLAAGLPVIFGFVVYESFESADVARTGVVPLPGLDERCFGGHAVLLVGYDDDARLFTVRNSWGPDWGDGGYCYFPYSALLDRDATDDFWVVRVVP